MEKVVGNIAGSKTTTVSDKKSSNSKMADTPHGREDPNRPSSVGPTNRRTGGENEAGPGGAGIKRVRGGDVFESRAGDKKASPNLNLRPLDVFVPADASYISAGLGFPFTHAQWQELARQAMIYKYMISSVPVPRHLLRTALDYSSAPPSGKYHHPRTGSDPEPGRCKRTDGKKWRCSRDVAPQQKYCERHLHRGRPRSRKRVESAAAAANKLIINNNADEGDHSKKTTHNNKLFPKSPRIITSSQQQQQQQQKLFAATNLPLFNAAAAAAATDLTISPSYYKGPTLNHRNLGLMNMEEPNIESGNTGLISSLYNGSSSMLYNQDYYYYTEQQQQQQHVPVNLLLNSKLPVSEIESPMGFCWPVNSNNADHDEENLLALSLGDPAAAAALLGYNEEQTTGGRGRIESRDDFMTEDSRFSIMGVGGPNYSWGPIAYNGGPLAEALIQQHNSNSGGSSSSPSGVIQRSLFSLSDNSACNSPPTLETSLRWFS